MLFCPRRTTVFLGSFTNSNSRCRTQKGSFWSKDSRLPYLTRASSASSSEWEWLALVLCSNQCACVIITSPSMYESLLVEEQYEGKASFEKQYEACNKALKESGKLPSSAHACILLGPQQIYPYHSNTPGTGGTTFAQEHAPEALSNMCAITAVNRPMIIPFMHPSIMNDPDGRYHLGQDDLYTCDDGLGIYWNSKSLQLKQVMHAKDVTVVVRPSPFKAPKTVIGAGALIHIHSHISKLHAHARNLGLIAPPCRRTRLFIPANRARLRCLDAGALNNTRYTRTWYLSMTARLKLVIVLKNCYHDPQYRIWTCLPSGSWRVLAITSLTCMEHTSSLARVRSTRYMHTHFLWMNVCAYVRAYIYIWCVYTCGHATI